MKRRRWVVVGLAVLALAALFFVVLRSGSGAPFKFIHGRRVDTRVSQYVYRIGQTGPPYCYSDFYVFPGSVEGVRKEAAKELASLGYEDVSGDGSCWVNYRRAGTPHVEIGYASIVAFWSELGGPVEVPPGSVIVRVTRSEPSFIERLQEWAHSIGL